MNRRIVLLLVFVFAGALAFAVVADKKATPLVKVSRVEGRAEEFVLTPTSISTESKAPWSVKKASKGDEPELEFTEPTGRSMTLELFFDGFETKENVYEKNVKPLEGLTLADPALDRPPMVKVVWGSLPAFSGVVESVSTRYTMFLEDGTPVRCTTNITMKAASKASTKSSPNPCP